MTSLQKGNKLVHLCFEVPNLEKALEAAKAHQFSCFKKPVPGVAFDMRPIAWLFHKHYGVIEIIGYH